MIANRAGFLLPGFPAPPFRQPGACPPVVRDLVPPCNPDTIQSAQMLQHRVQPADPARTADDSEMQAYGHHFRRRGAFRPEPVDGIDAAGQDEKQLLGSVNGASGAAVDGIDAQLLGDAARPSRVLHVFRQRPTEAIGKDDMATAQDSNEPHGGCFES